MSAPTPQIPGPAGAAHCPPTDPGTPHEQLPTLAQVLADAGRYLQQAVNTLGRQYDPTSGPQPDAWDQRPREADTQLGNAVATIRAVLDDLEKVADTLPLDSFVLPETPRVPSFGSYQPVAVSHSTTSPETCYCGTCRPRISG